MAVNLPPLVITPESSAEEEQKTSPFAPPQIEENSDTVPFAPPSNQNTVPSDNYAREIATKAEIGFRGYTPMGTEDYYNMVKAGQEEVIRRDLVIKKEEEAYREKIKTLDQLSASSNRPLTRQEIDAVLDPWNKPHDPSSVIEEAYSKKYIGSLDDGAAAMRAQTKFEADREMPQFVEKTREAGTDYMNKIQYVQKSANIWRDKVSDQSWPGYIADFGKNLFQPYVEIMQRGSLDPDAGLTRDGLLLGSNIRSQIGTLFQQDFGTFKQRIDSLFKQFENNPQLGEQLIGEILAGTNSSALLNNVFSVAQIPDHFTLLKGSSKLAKSAYNARYVSRAVKDHVEAARNSIKTNPNPHQVNSVPVLTPEAAMAEGAGDVHTAAVNTVSNYIRQAIEGNEADPIAFTRMQLMSNQKDDIERLVQGNLGRMSRETATRLADEMMARSTQLLDKIQESVRVSRNPLATATKENVEALLNEIKDNFHGPEASVLNQELIHNPFTNTLHVKQTLGYYDGSIIPSEDFAHGHAQSLGLSPKTTTPDVADGYTRLYVTRTGKNKTLATTDLTYARDFNSKGNVRAVQYVDIPNDSPFVMKAQADGFIFRNEEAIGKQNPRIELPNEYVAQLQKFDSSAPQEGYRLVQREGPLLDAGIPENLSRKDFLTRAVEYTQNRIAAAKKFLKETQETPMPDRQSKRFYTSDDGKTLHPTLEAARGDRKQAIKYKTESGKEYTVHLDKTTSRRLKKGETEVGPQERSKRTVYVSSEKAEALKAPESGTWKYVLNKEGTLSIAKWSPRFKKWGSSAEQKNIKVSNTPKKGMHAIELAQEETSNGLTGFRRASIGEKIASVSSDTVFDASKKIKHVDIKASSFGKAYPQALQDAEAKASGFKTFPGTEALQKRLKDMTGPEGATKAAKIAQLKEDTKLLENIQKELSGAAQRVQDDINSYNVRQHGLGFVIERTIPVDETSPLAKSLLTKDYRGEAVDILNARLEGAGGIANAIFGRFRTPDDILSMQETVERKIAVYGKAELEKFFSEVADYTRDVAQGRQRFHPVTGEPISWWLWKPRSYLGKISNRAVAKQFEKALVYAQTARDPITKRQGYYFRTAGELDDFYLRNFNRQASESEHYAYRMQAWTHEAQRSVMEINEYAYRAAQGTEQFKIKFKGPDGESIESDFFDAIRMKEFPGSDHRILILGRNKGEEKIETLGSNRLGNSLKEMREKVADGRATVLRIYARDHQPLDNFSSVAKGEPISYVYTENGVSSKPLEFNHVNRTSGGHWDYAYDNHIKMAKMRQEGASGKEGDRSLLRWAYYGDVTLMPIKNQVMGKRVTGVLNAAKNALKEGNVEEAMARLAPTGIPFDKFERWFKPAGGGKAVFDFNEDFRVVPKGRSIIDLDKKLEEKYKALQGGKDLYNGAKRGSPDLRFKVAYNEERGPNQLWTVTDEAGWSNKPVYAYRPAELEHPISTMNRAINNSVNSLWMNDYKQFAVNSWLEKAADHLIPTLDELRDSPLWYYNNASGMYKPGTKEEVKQNLENMRRMQQTFMGTPSNYDTMSHRVAQWAADTVYEKFGPKTSLIPEWLLSHSQDPVNFLRSVAFNAKIGLFSLPQLFVQMQTHANIVGIEPRHGTSGTWAAMLHGWSSLNGNKAVLEGIDSLATKMNVLGSKWRPGEFLEARDALRKSGFANVSGEHALGDNSMMHNYFTNDAQGFLHAGQAFFRMGERSPRIAAWYTSFRKFRDANPTKALTQQDLKQILNYADTLTFNMSRASSSSLHTGVFSLMTQFLAYQMRAIELFMGKRLGDTVGERAVKRASLLTAYSALYGIPGMTGLFVYPWGEPMKKWAVDHGYVQGDSTWQTIAMEGFPAYAVAFVTGGGDIRKGNFEDFSGRYGIQGFTQAGEVAKTESNLLKIFGGASLNIMANVYKRMPGFWDALSLASNNPDKKWKPKLDDIIDPLREVSSVNQGYTFYQALATGMRINRNEGFVTEVSPMRAFGHMVTGLSPTDQSRAFTKSLITKDVTDSQKEAFQKFTVEYQRYKIAKRNDDKTATDYWDRAKHVLDTYDIPDDLRAEFIQRAARSDDNTISDNSDRSFYLGRKTPKSKVEGRRDAYRKTLKMKDLKKENN